MTFSIFMNPALNGDPFRVVAAASDVADDLDPLVLFSSKWRGAAAELHEVPGASGTGTISFSRTYSSPIVLGCFYNGTTQYPHGYALFSRSGGSWLLESTHKFKLAAASSYCAYDLANLGAGTLRVMVLGT